MAWYIRLFGKIEMERGGVVITHFRTKKTALLLAYLALTPPHRFTRSFLADLLWGDQASENARHSLSLVLSALRSALEQPDLPAGDVLQTDRHFVGLNPDYFTTDVMQFEHAIAMAHHPEEPLAYRQVWLERAADLYHGDCLAGAEEAWAVEIQMRLQAEYLRVLSQLADWAGQAGELTRQQAWLHQLLRTDPLDWRAAEQLVRSYLQAGQPRLAQQFQTHFESEWRQVYGESPPAVFETLRQECDTALTRSAPQSAATPPTERVPRTKQPARDFPTRRCLPYVADNFYGREQELEQLQQWLMNERARLVTITGLGGMGKTRLALELAKRIETQRRFPVWWSSVQAIQTLDAFWEALCSALRLPNTSSPQQAVLECLREAAGLIVLDGFESLLPAGGGAVEQVLACCPQTQLLLTSRAPLEIEGEYVLRLGPLAVCPKSGESLSPAAQLFIDRAKHFYPEFRFTLSRQVAVEQVCRELEGFPLAVELAATRVGILTPRQMLERMDERWQWLRTARHHLPPQHRNLYALLETCANALDPATRDLWLRLAVFQGGWSLEAAQWVWGLPDLLERLEALAMRGFIQCVEHQERWRMQMLNLVRDYARLQWTPTLRAEVEQRLLEWCVDAARRQAALHSGDELEPWLAFWDMEQQNLLSALAAAERHGAVEQALQLLQWTQRYWLQRGLQSVACEITERLIPHLTPEQRLEARQLQTAWLTNA